MKQNASMDASFWIDACSANIIQFLPDYFQLFATSVVADEVCYPLAKLQMPAHSAISFNRFVDVGFILKKEPVAVVDWYQAGENSAISLAIEHNYFLLIDDSNPYHRAKSQSLSVIDSNQMIVFLFEKGDITYELAITAIRQIRSNKGRKRKALTFLESLVCNKGI